MIAGPDGYEVAPVVRGGELVGEQYGRRRGPVVTWLIFGPFGKWAHRRRGVWWRVTLWLDGQGKS